MTFKNNKLIYSTHMSGAPLVIGAREQATPRTIRSISLQELGSFKAYAQPEDYAIGMIENAHYYAQAYMLQNFKRYLGERVVSLGCGSGWLDRKVVLMQARELTKKNSTTQLRLLGIDLSPESIVLAIRKMENLLDENPALRTCREEGRFLYEYKLAMLGGSTNIKCNNQTVYVEDFADIDLKKTVIGQKTADTFLAFYIFVLWIQNKEKAIKAIAEKSHKESPHTWATTLWNGEEYPIHITPHCMNRDFRRAARALLGQQVSTEMLWNELFPKHGFKKKKETSYSFAKGQDHEMRFALSEFKGECF